MKILLATLHSRYSHPSLALPSLAACCTDMPGVEIVISELTVNEAHERLLQRIVSEHADIAAFSCYIWNIEETLRLVSDLKKIFPETLTLLGGPEVSYGIFELMNCNPGIDYVIKGEGEKSFRMLTAKLAGLMDGPIPGLFRRDGEDIVSPPAANGDTSLAAIPSPFAAGLVDLSKPLVYFETSRGCPFSCAFCLSSTERNLRSFPEERVRSDLELLIRRNVPVVKLVDRTFNFDSKRSAKIWEFILEKNGNSNFHFEIAADLLTDDNISLLKKAPPGKFRFEIGVQSSSKETLASVKRNAETGKLFENIRRLKRETAVLLHLDLIAGLPGEDYCGFLDSLQHVADLEPHEIQIEPLKLLKGTEMRKIANERGYRYSDFPPYAVLSTPDLSYDEICRIETIGRLIDLFYNSSNFGTALRHMRRRMKFAELFDRMGGSVSGENLSGYSRLRRHELFARLAARLLPPEEIQPLHDALFFDYCSMELPLKGKLPIFIKDKESSCEWPGRSALPDRVKFPAGCMVKCFRFTFSADYRNEIPVNVPAPVTFAYISEPGGGLKVLLF